MEESKGELEPGRLFDAAEAVLRLLAQKSGPATNPSPAAASAAPVPARAISTFTRWEIEQAGQFLARLGFLERPRPDKAV